MRIPSSELYHELSAACPYCIQTFASFPELSLDAEEQDQVTGGDEQDQVTGGDEQDQVTGGDEQNQVTDADIASAHLHS